jgi:HD-GYP domain-containing protein (c-di-GMP phosphodiesterase class II)
MLVAFATIFAGLADTKGEHTAAHGARTASVAQELAQSVGLSKQRSQDVYLAALLHDIGLLGVPARVIAKPDILSLTEMEAMRKHPTFSQQILEGLPGLEEIALWAGAHHERPDGKGYPELLESDVVPLEARIIAVADTYVALTSERPYRHALTKDDAYAVLQGGAGTQLDAELVRVLCSGETTPTTSSRSAPRSTRRR